jgi:PadR family transcriptional regulator, regulatory protein PadR
MRDPMNVSKDLVAASAIPLILSILKETDSYGYSIIKRVKELSDSQLIWTEGMLYPVLHRLEEQGLIESYWKGSQTGRQRKYYKINAEGLKELDMHKKQWEMVHSTLLKTLESKQ